MNQNIKPAGSNYCFISGPVISPTLLRAIQTCDIPVYVQPPTSALPETINILQDAEAVSLIQNENAIAIMNWEASLSFILENLPQQRLNQVNAFKNKATFRKLVKELYPNLFYVELTRDNLLDFRLPEEVETVVLKPSLGTASIGIRTVHGQQQWEKAVDSVIKDIDIAKEHMNPAMLNDSSFLVEEFVDGDEFACDGFWNANGKTVITGIYQHPFASSLDVSDTVYYTSKKVVAETIEPTIQVLEHIGNKLGMRRFPFHFEFRLSNSNLFPIELNPLRFGQVSLPDITEYAFGFNPYDLFFADERPDWDSLLTDVSNSKVYAFVLASIPPKYKSEKYRFDEESFCDNFGDRLLNYLPSNPEITPFFGVAHIVVDKVEDVLEYLNLDFGSFLRSRE
ncbi:ATP-grasp domain-containing protein [Rivularia sp. UHCC 0363]|uniref:ATP-grasp domain-containing protein n=1 Tax=Rivularia sp. UHCC 0363 TaxID=3110244 RepID=UPI002B2106F2|nr:ATP-grasp domain-containing protein [Rivularia sp. UHCC 0363]MEA5594985.1 ATP-grasp domain-containing protein [Rivularia sp. UHCC 0363]